MVNGYYDFLSPGQDNYNSLAPFVGVGIGYVYVQNFIEFYFNQTPLQRIQPVSVFETVAAQAIVGLSYFLDDFTTITLDGRYFASAKTSEKRQYGFNTLVNQDKFYSINIGFSGAIDVG